MKGLGEQGKGADEGDRAPVDTARRRERPRAAARPPREGHSPSAIAGPPAARGSPLWRDGNGAGPSARPIHATLPAARARPPRPEGPDVETVRVWLGAALESVSESWLWCQVQRPVFL